MTSKMTLRSLPLGAIQTSSPLTGTLTGLQLPGVLQLPPLQAGQMFRLKSADGNLTGSYYPVVLLYMQGGGDIIAVDNLDYTACDSSISGRCEAAVLYPFSGQAVNVTGQAEAF